MSTAIRDSFVDHSALDGTGDAINGSEVDENGNTIADILDGTTATDLAGAGTLDFVFTDTRSGIRLLDLNNAAGAVHTGLTIEWDPADGGNLTDNTSGVGIDFKMPDDADNQDVFASLNVIVVDDATATEDGEFSFKVATAGTNTEQMTLSASALTVTPPSTLTGLVTATAGITSGANIVSDTDSTDDLGTTSVRWANLYVNSIGDSGQALTITAGANNVNMTAGTFALTGAQTVSSTLGVTGLTTATGGVTSGGNIISDTDSTDDLGTSSVRWANLYVDSIGDTGQALDVAATTLSFNTTSAIDTSGNNALTLNSGTAALTITAGDVTIFDDNNNADTSLSVGTSATEALKIEVLNGAANKTAEEVRFTTSTASATADHGKISFYVDDAQIATIDDGGIDLAAGLAFTVNGAAIGGAALTGSTDNTIVTVTGADAMQGEANLTFDGTTLQVGSGIATPNTNGDNLVLNSTGNVGLSILGDTASSASIIYFGIDGDESDGRIFYQNSATTPFMDFYTADTLAMRIDSSGDLVMASGNNIKIGPGAAILHIDATGVHTNANMSQGITINQGASDNEIFALKSSDVAHGMTSIAETDTYAFFKKQNPTEGGLFIEALSEGQFAFSVQSVVTTVNTAKTTGAYSPHDFDAYKKSGTSQTGVGANGNVFNIRSNGATRFIFDNEGDSHQDVGTAWTNFDNYDDAQLTRSLGLALSPQSAIQTRWDDWGRDHQALIEEVGLVPKLTEEQKARGERGLVNTSLLQRIHNGAIWQLHTETQDIKEMVAMTRNDFQAAIEARDAEIRELRNEMKLLKGRK